MTLKLGVVMDPIGSIYYKKDSTLAMLWEAKARGYEIYYFEQTNLFVRDGVPLGDARLLDVTKNEKSWYSFKGEKQIALADLDIILMRKDPPFNEEYIYTTYVLDLAEQLGVLVMNRPQALRDANEKFFVTQFPQCTPPTLVTQSAEKLRAFCKEFGDVVCKPLNSMGGTSVFRLHENDVNANVIFEMLTRNGTFYIMAQQFIPEIKNGDKRILMINGEPVPHVLARMPHSNDWRGNLSAGAKGIAQPLSERDRWIASEVGPFLRERGILFAGLDVIGDYLTEINITSPTCIRELDDQVGLHISAQLFDAIELIRK